MYSSCNKESFRTLLRDFPPWGMYVPSGYDPNTNTLREARNNGRDASTKNVSIGAASGNGALVSLPYLHGLKTSSITWPMGSLPINFTMCSLTRYNDIAVNSNRIINGQVANFVHANNSGGRRINFYNATYGHDEIGTFPNIWYNCCGMNNRGATSPNLYTNGISSKIMSLNPPPTIADGLVINQLNSGSESDFQLGLLFVWDRHLRSDQLLLIFNEIESYKNTGILTLLD